jgi:hypothetical protein
VIEDAIAGRSEGRPSEEKAKADAAASTDDVDPWDEPTPTRAEAEAGDPEETASGASEPQAKGNGTSAPSGGDAKLLDEPDPWD